MPLARSRKTVKASAAGCSVSVFIHAAHKTMGPAPCTSPRKRGSHMVISPQEVLNMSEKKFYVYIMFDKPYGTLYIGQTNNLARRVYEHKNGLIKGFTERYGLKRLAYYEIYDNPNEGFARERALKKWNRDWKIDLIHSVNRDWDDLSDKLQ